MSRSLSTEKPSQDFNADMQSFFHLFTRYTEGGGTSELMYSICSGCMHATVSHIISSCRDWEKVKALPENQIVSYDQLPVSVNVAGLANLAVLKVNGGLGTSMG